MSVRPSVFFPCQECIFGSVLVNVIPTGTLSMTLPIPREVRRISLRLGDIFVELAQVDPFLEPITISKDSSTCCNAGDRKARTAHQSRPVSSS
jgi:hypothetical protein